MMINRSLHHAGCMLLLLPGTMIVAYAATADLRGGRFFADWGTGQTVLSVLGTLVICLGWITHNKALKDEAGGRRRYQRTVAFIAILAFAVTCVPVLLGEAITRLLVSPSSSISGYQKFDPSLGVVLTPDREFRVSSVAKLFDVRIRIDAEGFRYDETPVELSQADAVVVGDSHAFGWGIDEDKTLSVQLSKRLAMAGRPSQVVNAGVPGYGLTEFVLRIERMQGKLPRDATIVLFVNPINDLVNASMELDYSFAKPHAVLTDSQLVIAPPSDPGGQPFQFSESFEELREVFLHSGPPWFSRSAMYQWLMQRNVSRDAKVEDGVTLMRDETTAEQFLEDDRRRVADAPKLYAARYWPEDPQWQTERERLRKITQLLLLRLGKVVQENHWNLIVVLAPEAIHYQEYTQDFVDQFQAHWPESNIEPGWCRGMLMDTCSELSFDVVTWDDVQVEPERSFLPYDDHTSAIGHGHIADGVSNHL